MLLFYFNKIICSTNFCVVLFDFGFFFTFSAKCIKTKIFFEISLKYHY